MTDVEADGVGSREIVRSGHRFEGVIVDINVEGVEADGVSSDTVRFASYSDGRALKLMVSVQNEGYVIVNGYWFDRDMVRFASYSDVRARARLIFIIEMKVKCQILVPELGLALVVRALELLKKVSSVSDDGVQDGALGLW
ncbi:E3 Ubiquitin-Protein Ligase Mycbp2 [Manis pentadactyla]|nr:E3 Ubiquitin-Protein Ligase Mycbp2 [Manis pentadactyla]